MKPSIETATNAAYEVYMKSDNMSLDSVIESLSLVYHVPNQQILDIIYDLAVK